MQAMGIDIGTTTISVVMMDGSSGELLGSRTVAHDTFIKGHRREAKLQDPERIVQIARETVLDLVNECGVPNCIGLTGQMHGMLYVDVAGNAVSPLYIWQDGCGNLPASDGRSYAEILKETGGAAASGYGLVSHYYLQKNGLVPEQAVKMATISDYVGMKLCGLKEPVIGRDMAASWGGYDLKNDQFLTEEMERLGVDTSYLPYLMKEHTVMGHTILEGSSGIPVIVSLGDNQASVLGSVQDLCETVLINVGTGSQISVGTRQYHDCQGAVEFRPCVGDISLLAGCGLCGGRAYAMLEQFYRQVSGSQETVYARMEEQARAFMVERGRDAAWQVRTTFSGTRSDPAQRGSIGGIGVDNFHPGAMTLGMIRGILEELHEMYEQMCERTGHKATRLAGSGNGIRRNPLMREMAEEMFGMEMVIPACREEAAYGAALHSLAAAGLVSGMKEAQKKLRYECHA